MPQISYKLTEDEGQIIATIRQQYLDGLQNPKTKDRVIEAIQYIHTKGGALNQAEMRRVAPYMKHLERMNRRIDAGLKEFRRVKRG